jgi:hemolysin D
MTTLQPSGLRNQRRTHLPRSTRGWSRAIAWSLMGLTCFGVGFGTIARIDTSISATGKLRPVEGIREVSPPFAAPIIRVRVSEGQQVRAGQVLVELEMEEWRRERQTLRTLMALWEKDASQAARQLGLPAAGRPGRDEGNSLRNEVRDLQLQRRAADQRRLRTTATVRQQEQQLEVLQKKYALNGRIRSRMEKLWKQGAISLLELERHDERQIELLGSIRKTEQELDAARRSLSETETAVEQVGTTNFKSLWDRYNSARKQSLELGARLNQVDERLQRSVLLAPVAGRVFDLKAKTGETSRVGEALLKIVPEQALEAVLSISNRDIGFLRPGMAVDVRVTSFPFTDYGSLRGTLLRVGVDAMPPNPQHPQEYFAAVARLERNSLVRHGEGGAYPLRSGMEVSALIHTGSRPLISLLNDKVGAFLESARSIR